MNARVARVLHVAFVIGVAAVFIVFGFVRDLTGFESPVLPPLFVRLGAAVLAGGALIAYRVLRAALPPPGSADDADGWWAAHVARVILVWGVADGLALAGAVLWFLTGDFVTLIIAGGAGLFLLAVTHPGRLTRG
jgi:hypothetical protein